MATAATPATLTLDRTQIHDAVMDAIGIAEIDRVAISLMPSDVFEGAGFDEYDGWTAENGKQEFLDALNAHLGNERIRNGEAEAYMRRYSHQEPREFPSVSRPCVSVYLTYVNPGGCASYVLFEVGPSGGYPVN